MKEQHPGFNTPSPSCQPQLYPPWNGNVDPGHLIKSPSMLLAALLSCAGQCGHRLLDLAKRLDISYAYLLMLRTGERSVPERSHHRFTLNAARYLGIPRATALLLAELPLGELTEADFLEANELPADRVREAMEAIAEDKAFGPLVTEELQQSSLETRYTFVRYFEAQTRVAFLPERLDLPRITAGVEALKAAREELRRQQDAGGAKRPKA